MGNGGGEIEVMRGVCKKQPWKEREKYLEKDIRGRKRNNHEKKEGNILEKILEEEKEGRDEKIIWGWGWACKRFKKEKKRF